MKYSLLTLITGVAFGATIASAEVTWLSGSSKLPFDQVPANVQNVIKGQAGTAEIEDVEKGTLNGQTVYEAAYKHNGQHTELRVAENGTIVDTIVEGQSTGAGGNTASTATSTSSSSTASTAAAAGATSTDYNAGFQKELSGGGKVTYDQLPANLKQIVKERAGAAKIEDIDKGKLNGKPAYQAAFKRNGKNVELRMTETGKFVKEVVEGKQTYTYSLTTLAAVPQNIRSIVQSKIGNAPVTAALSGTSAVHGQFYRFFYNKNGKNTELRIFDNGKDVKEVASNPIISESAGANK